LGCEPPESSVSPAGRRFHLARVHNLRLHNLRLHGVYLQGRCGGRLRFRPDDIDASLEVGAIVDTDARRLDITNQTALFADRKLFGYLYGPADGAIDHYLPCLA